MDINEFIEKMAEQQRNLLKVIDLQNNSIKSLNDRINALTASQLVIFALLLELDNTGNNKVSQHLQAVLANPQIASNQHLISQLKEFLDICEERKETADTPQKTGAPNWFKGIVQGGLSLASKEKPPKKKE